jgi:AcrR family transcriptional regulator
MTEPARGLKKKPLQKRSQERVARILAAASEILSEVGYEGLTTNLIAARAQVPIGTLYQFFERKDDIVAALIADFTDRLDGLMSDTLTATLLKRDVTAFVAKFIDGIASIQRQSSAFVCLYAGSQSQHEFDGLAAELRQTLTRRLDRIFGEAFPNLPVSDRRRILSVWQEVARSMIASLDKKKPSEREAIIGELKLILSSYFLAKLETLKRN